MLKRISCYYIEHINGSNQNTVMVGVSLCIYEDLDRILTFINIECPPFSIDKVFTSEEVNCRNVTSVIVLDFYSV